MDKIIKKKNITTAWTWTALSLLILVLPCIQAFSNIPEDAPATRVAVAAIFTLLFTVMAAVSFVSGLLGHLKTRARLSGIVLLVAGAVLIYTVIFFTVPNILRIYF